MQYYYAKDYESKIFCRQMRYQTTRSHDYCVLDNFDWGGEGGGGGGGGGGGSGGLKWELEGGEDLQGIFQSNILILPSQKLQKMHLQ